MTAKFTLNVKAKGSEEEAAAAKAAETEKTAEKEEKGGYKAKVKARHAK